MHLIGFTVKNIGVKRRIYWRCLKIQPKFDVHVLTKGWERMKRKEMAVEENEIIFSSKDIQKKKCYLKTMRT